MFDKVITLIDMDCFYVQVEARENPSLQGVPAAVVQYNAWKGGGIIAVNYEARAMGVSRQMRGDEAREKCPDIVLVKVPEVRDKADLSKYRRAGREVIEVLLQSGAVVERASIDEAYLDLTRVVEDRMKKGVTAEMIANTFIGSNKENRDDVVKTWVDEMKDEETGNPGDLRLAVGAVIVEEIRLEVFKQTKFRCSAGIAHCKTLAKLCAGLNKPNRQTVLPQSSVPDLYSTLPVTKVRGLGGKLGESVVSGLGCETMGQVAELSLSTIERHVDSKTAAWLFHLATAGLDNEEVKERELPQSIGCGKNFRGPDMLDTKEKVRHRLSNLVEELVERMEVDKAEYNRMARGLTVGVGLEDQGYVSRAGQIYGYNVDQVFREAFGLLSRLNKAPADSESWFPKLKNVSIVASKFEDLNATIGSTKSITSFFAKKQDDANSEQHDTTTKLKSKEVPPCDVNQMEANSKESDHITQQISDNGDTDNTINCDIDIAELIPSLEGFDKSIIDFLPAKLKIKARERMKTLENKGDGAESLNKVINNVRISTSDLLGTLPSGIKHFFKKKTFENVEEKGDKMCDNSDIDIILNVQRETTTLSEPLDSSKSTSNQPGTSSPRNGYFLKHEPSENTEGTGNKASDKSYVHRETLSNNEDVKDYNQSSEEIDISELIPSLDQFDSSILEFLPSNMKSKALERVKILKAESSGISRFFTKKQLKADTDCKINLNEKENINDQLQSHNNVDESLLNESIPESNFVPCDECSELVSPFELPEHLDFHYAMSLNIGRGSSPSISSLSSVDSRGTSKLSSGQKRKRQSEKILIKKSCNDISSFFSKK